MITNDDVTEKEMESEKGRKREKEKEPSQVKLRRSKKEEVGYFRHAADFLLLPVVN